MIYDFSVLCRLTRLSCAKYTWGLSCDHSQTAAWTRASWRLDSTEYPKCFLYIHVWYLGAVWSLPLSPSTATLLILWFFILWGYFMEPLVFSQNSGLTWYPRSRKPKLPGQLKTIPRSRTASGLPCSLNRSSHRENPKGKQQRTDSSSWWRSGKITSQKSMYNKRCYDHLWKV